MSRRSSVGPKGAVVSFLKRRLQEPLARSSSSSGKNQSPGGSDLDNKVCDQGEWETRGVERLAAADGS